MNFSYRIALRGRSVALVAVGLLLLAMPTAWAHKAGCFVAVDGATLRGRVWTGEEHPVHDAPVRILGPAGERLGETETDEKGSFSFTATRRCDHLFVVTISPGHEARFLVHSEKLPVSLPTLAATEIAPDHLFVTGDAHAVDDDHGHDDLPHDEDAHDEDEELHRELDALGVQIAELRTELHLQADQRRWQDVVAGVGYLLGLTGIACLFLSRRRGHNGPGQ